VPLGSSTCIPNLRATVMRAGRPPYPADRKNPHMRNRDPQCLGLHCGAPASAGLVSLRSHIYDLDLLGEHLRVHHLRRPHASLPARQQ
jgi:hypothetical protein